MKSPTRLFYLTISLSLISTLVFPAGPINISSKGIAVRGYDVTSYFSSKKPKKGLHRHSHRWQNAKWLFYSFINKEAFKKKPTQFSPQYGGFCSFSASYNFPADADPTIWHIHKNKLYLFHSKEVKKRWLGEMKRYIQRADKYWKK